MNSVNNKIDRYQLFYIEAIMSDTAFPEIGRIRPLFDNLSLPEFIELIDKIFESGDYDAAQQFLYFLMLFRDMKHIQEYMNSDSFSVEYLEKFIIFTYGYCTLHDHSTERVIDEILYFLRNDRLLDLVLYSRFIFNDKLLLFFILSKFDVELLERYFNNIEDRVKFVNSFIRLPEKILKAIISRNYHIFRYIMQLVENEKENVELPPDFLGKFRDDIAQFSRLASILKKYRSISGRYGDEKDLPFHKRDMERISFLVNMVKDLPNPVKAVEYFSAEHVFVDEMEKGVVVAIITDPMLKNVFSGYGSMLEP